MVDIVALWIVIMYVSIILSGFIDLLIYMYIETHCSYDTRRKYTYSYYVLKIQFIFFKEMFIYIYNKTWLILAYMPRKIYKIYKIPKILREIRNNDKYKEHIDYINSELKRSTIKQLYKWEKQ